MQAHFRVLAPEVFEFVLTNELKRAVRSQTYLTLLLVEPSFPEASAEDIGEREQLTSRIAELIGCEVRETDLLAQTRSGQLSLVVALDEMGEASAWMSPATGFAHASPR